MYFDLEPKHRREDLYNFDKQLGKLLDILRGRRAKYPLTIITGLRRMGKTSLAKTALNESNLPNLTLNGMAFADVPAIKKRSLLRALERGLNEAIESQKKWRKSLLEVLGGVRWIRVNSKPPFIHFEWERPTKDFDISDIVHSFNRLAEEKKTKFVLVIDEAQEFRKLKGYNLQAQMAYIYDDLKGVQIIVTGSQIGLLHDFLGIDDSAAPLYGRGMAEIMVPRITDDLAADFLREGFKQAKIKAKADVIDLVVEKLDGIIGWLTFFGAKSVEAGGPSEKTLNETIKRGSELTAEELIKFLKLRKQAKKRYIRILKTAVRLGQATWTDLKESLEAREKKHIANNVFSNLVENLAKGAFLRKNEDGTYSVSDPILAHSIRSTR